MKIRRQKNKSRRQIFINRDGKTQCLDTAVIARLTKSAEAISRRLKRQSDDEIASLRSQ
jgi:hypothetical protein